MLSKSIDKQWRFGDALSGIVSARQLLSSAKCSLFLSVSVSEVALLLLTVCFTPCSKQYLHLMSLCKRHVSCVLRLVPRRCVFIKHF